MKNFLLGAVLCMTVFLIGCEGKHNFMDIDNPNAKDDFRALFGSGNTGNIFSKDIIPDNFSGSWETIKGYAGKYYDNTIEQYVDKAKLGFSGAVKNLKDQYNSGVDKITNTINDKVTGTISGELNKFKLQ